MKNLQHTLNLLGRILIAVIFFFSGVGKILDMEGTKQYMAANGMPAVTFFLIGAIILELLGGLLILIGCGSRIGAFLLIVFLIPTTFIFHMNLGEQLQMIMFLKNLAILGGLLMILAHGSGSFGVDRLWKVT